MNQPLYQAINPSDQAQLKSLLNELGYDLDDARIEQHIREIRNRGGEVFVAKLADRVVGCVAAIVDVRLAAGIQGEIVSLVVTEPYRGQGIGNGLIKSAEDWLSQTVDTIRVRANSQRRDAHRFYAKAGYELSKTQKIFTKHRLNASLADPEKLA